MERGKLYFHYLADEEFLCEQNGQGFDNEPRFKLCLVGDDERIEIRDITAKELAGLRDKISAALESAPKKEPTSEGVGANLNSPATSG